jgi:hypothetical protein
MLQSPDSAGLPFESAQACRIPAQLARENLDGNVSIELGIARPVHLAHSARPDETEDFETPQAISSLQRHDRTPPMIIDC